MTEEEWPTGREPHPMLDFVRSRASERKFRLFACALCETYRREFPDERSWAAVETAYRVADGLASEAEREAALEDALAAAEEEDPGHWFATTAFIPACTVGSRNQLNQVPRFVLEEFDSNFYSNP